MLSEIHLEVEMTEVHLSPEVEIPEVHLSSEVEMTEIHLHLLVLVLMSLYRQIEASASGIVASG